MSFSVLPLGYCTNVHPGLTVSEVIDGLSKYTSKVARNLDRPIAAGLWLAQPVIQELRELPQQINLLRDVLTEHGLVCYTLNAFPYGNFHSERVKENVYIPDWATDERLKYTINCAEILAQLLPPGTEGSISTVPLGFKGFDHPEDFQQQCIDNLIDLAKRLDELHDESGQVIRLAIEPEPLCILETTTETIQFFEALRKVADDTNCRDITDRHLGVCYDVCHQSVEFEDIEESITQLDQAAIRINKVHITCAVEIEKSSRNKSALEALAHFIEPRYLHQTFVKLADGSIHRETDLNTQLVESTPEELIDAEMWRVHYHVPVNAASIGPLGTTRADLKKALETVHQLDYAPHLEVETYTWNVLPGETTPDLISGMTAELKATYDLLENIANPKTGFRPLI